MHPSFNATNALSAAVPPNVAALRGAQYGLKLPNIDAVNPSRDVFVLGAGYSRAVHPAMPTLKDLGHRLAQTVLGSPRRLALVPEEVVDRLRSGYLPGGNLESWLSTLAEKQPFLSESESAHNYGLFLELSEALVTLVGQAQDDFLSSAPAWSRRLVSLWHAGRPAVVTFNYDTIIEEIVVSLDIPGTKGTIADAILGYLPRYALSVWGSAGEPPTFRLFKLHGSVDWLWNPSDASGDSLCRIPAGADEDDARAARAGKVPFIVPPLATKGPFYSVGILRQLWQDARQAMERAERVVLFGYSLPLTDLTVLAMISAAVSSKAVWHVVDPSHGEVANRLQILGVSRDMITGHESAGTFVAEYEREQSGSMTKDIVAELEAYPVGNKSPIMVRQHRAGTALATHIRTEASKLVVDATNLTEHSPSIRNGIPAHYPRRETLLEELRRVAKPIPIVVRFDESPEEFVVLGAGDPKDVRGGVGVLEWVVLETQSEPSLPHAAGSPNSVSEAG